MGNGDVPSSAEQVEARLRERLGTRVQGLRVLVRDGGVVLRGTVYTGYSRQVAQQVATQELGLTVVANEIEVRWDLDGPVPTDRGPEC